MELNQIIETLKKEQQQMQQMDAMLNAVVKQAMDGIITVLHDGSLASVNPAAAEILNLQNREINGTSLADFFTDEAGATFALDELPKYAGQVMTLYVPSDTTRIPVSVSFSENIIGEDRFYTLFVRDMRIQQVQHEQVVEREKLLEAVIETAADGVVIIDGRGLIVTFNTACERLFGYKRSEVIGQKINMLMPEEHSKNHDAHIDRYHTTGERHIVGRGREVPGRRKDGHVFPMYLSVSEASMNNKKVFTGIIRDLSQQRDQERMLVEETIKRAKAEEINFSMEQSVNYAHRIQQSILPTPSEIYAQLDCFVYFKPKEVLSGDFYWYMKKGDHLFLAVVDCTGHGIPGAFMSMLGYTHFNYVVNSSRSNDPARILTHLDERIATALGQRTGNANSDDSMDVAMVRINTATREVVFCGAKRPLMYLENGEIKTIRGTKSSIGGKDKPAVAFESHSLVMQPGDSFYLYSDGLTDQFNDKGDKYSQKLFQQYVEENHLNSMRGIGDKLELDMYRWRGREQPMDDITVIGVRL